MLSPTSTFDLLEQAKNGNQEALSRVFEKHPRRLVVLVHFKLGSRAPEFAEAEDVVQEACLLTAGEQELRDLVRSHR